MSPSLAIIALSHSLAPLHLSKILGMSWHISLQKNKKAYCALFGVPYYSHCKPIHSKKRHVIPAHGIPLPLTKHPPSCCASSKKRFVVPVPGVPLPLIKHPLAMPHPKKWYAVPVPGVPLLLIKHPLAMPHPKKGYIIPPCSIPLPLTKHPLAVPHPKKRYVVPVPSIPPPLTKHPLTVLHPKKRTPPHCAYPKKKVVVSLYHSQNTPSPCLSKKKNTPLLCLILQKMVKTKQTAKKTTGGRAPRVSLAGLKAREKQASKSSKAHARKAPVAKKRRMRNLAKVTQLPVTFRCVACHWKMTRFESPQPYFGFYLSGKPVLKHPLVVIGGFEHATTSEVAGNSTAIIHLHLESLELGHAPVHILHTMLQGYFTQDTYHFSQLPFNFATEESRAAYDTAASKLASSLTTFAEVVIFLTTHTDEDRGDLFSGMENKVPIATEVFELQFLHGLLLPFSNIVKGGDLIFFVCGSTVRKEESFQGLQAAVQHFKPRSMLLFDAERLQLVTTIPFLMSVLDSTIVQGFHVQSAVRHSNIILMLWQEKVVVEKFIWTDKFIRPLGQQLPAQCPQCYSIQKWEAGCSGQTYSYECKNPGCGKDTQGTSQPPKTYTICMSKGATKLTQGKGQTSSWLLESL
ncbi:hypothetical protein F5J12DRAFT_785251 [Pisolithus orientalis]|uniref:uncharacterized protein n=1 Tax=Pisolithus orientalis TaxID=936130 RepID=UPI0022243A56|nr:uncharacterized protein F5J12DRAFT_785251 [Pisolithus orientalis]KAI5996824.1 hypothetical protein F5J12DRAFT_785251 [Pisolithus orientalis]